MNKNETCFDDVGINDLHRLEEKYHWDCDPYRQALASGEYGENPEIILCQDGTAYLRPGYGYAYDTEILMPEWAVYEDDLQRGWEELRRVSRDNT